MVTFLVARATRNVQDCSSEAAEGGRQPTGMAPVQASRSHLLRSGPATHAARRDAAQAGPRRLAKDLPRSLLTTPGRMTVVQQWQAAVLAAGDGAVLAGLAAAQAGGLRGRFRRAVIDVLAPAETHFRPFPKALLREMSVVKVHRTTCLTRDDVQNGQPPHTIMARSVVDAAQWALDDDEAREIVARACQQRRVLPSELIAALKEQRRAKRSRADKGDSGYAEGGATTITEIDLVRLCARHGLPSPTCRCCARMRAGATGTWTHIGRSTSFMSR